ncbi:DUF2336 domain-containing protein [Ancylobacter rudongensis]|uniref:Uncharacterized conserved protein, DUF2336 family n=1 Tax=Ancylobacter rudongensis TaxID=177413 RepID=A0A1G4TD86_9HYPH|nr:DUF2336 domain-containing protein [Ancylobacter rudongensis]SCW79360.1 Uncharacterized conserved protein, DUF2336 family [Ancylobacter rudongensis]
MPSLSGTGPIDPHDTARRPYQDTRPAMLRLLVREFLRQPVLGEAAEARFITLAVRLIEGVDPTVAARHVREIAAHPALPRALARHLAAGPLALAGPILRLSPVLDEKDLAGLAEQAGPAHLAAMAARREVTPALAKRLAELTHRRSSEAAPEAPAAESFVEPPTAAPLVAEGPADFRAVPAESAPPAGPDFFLAGPEERASLIARLVTLPPLPLSERPAAPPSSFIDALLDAAKAKGTGDLAALMERALGVTPDNAARIIADDTGQSLAVVARALGLSFAILSRVLFRLHPVAGRSAGDMARLAEMFDDLPLASAQHLVASWRGGRRPGRERAEDAPSMRSFNAPHAPQQVPAVAESRQRKS